MKTLCLKTTSKIIAMLMVLTFTISTNHVSANLVNEPVQQGMAIIVDGNIPSGKAGVNVTVIVLKQYITVDQLSALPLKQAVDYIDQTISTTGGNYHFTILPTNDIDEGQVMLRFGSSAFQQAEEASVNYVPVQKIIDAINGVNNAYVVSNTKAQNRAAMKEALRSEELGLDATGAIDDYEISDQDVVHDYLLEVVKGQQFPVDDSNAIIDSATEIRRHFKIAVGLGCLSSADSEQSVDGFLTKYSTVMEIDTDEYDALDSGAFGIGKKTACSLIQNANISTIENVQTILSKGVALGFLNKSISWDNVRSAIELYADRFNVDLSTGSPFSKVKSKDNVYKVLADNVPYTEIDNVKDDFDNAVSSVLEDEEKPKSGGKGGGGSGSSMTVVVNPVPTPVVTPSPMLFNDIDSVPWAKESIESLAQVGILQGQAAGKFAPELPVTRTEFLKMLIMALKVPAADKDIEFIDVDKTAWHYKYVADAVNAGIVYGKTDGTFGANEKITRQDMAVMVARAANAVKIELPVKQNVEFIDGQTIEKYAYEQVYSLARAGIINGVGGQYYAPLDNATRAQAAKIIYAMFEMMEIKE